MSPSCTAVSSTLAEATFQFSVYVYVARTRVLWLIYSNVCVNCVRTESMYACPSYQYMFLFLSFAHARARAHALSSVWRKTGSRRIEQLRLTSNSRRNENLDTLAREFNLVPVYTMILSTREYLERLQGRTARCLSTTNHN